MLQSHFESIFAHAARRMAEVADPEDGLRVESASRLDWDRDRWLRRPLDAAVNPVKADSDFMAKLTFLLRKVINPVSSSGVALPALTHRFDASSLALPSANPRKDWGIQTELSAPIAPY